MDDDYTVGTNALGLASSLWAVYDAYIRVGFTEKQAFDLLLATFDHGDH